jgi:hypothetical protein
MDINREKHLNTTVSQFNNTMDDIEQLRKIDYAGKEFHAVLEKAIAWYETDNLNAYVFFHEAFPVSQSNPTSFYDGLHGFLVNTLLDDSCFELEWTKKDDNLDESPAEPFDEHIMVSVRVLWSNDDRPNRSIDAGLMLRAMEYLDEKDILREELDKEIDRLLE